MPQAKPFPALTPAQRLYLEVHGYVVIARVLSTDQVARLCDRLYAIEAQYRQTGALPGPHCHLSATAEDFFRVDNLPHLDPCFLEYLTHPRLLGMVEEITGGSVRLEQSDAHIRRPTSLEKQRYGFHRGMDVATGYSKNGLFHGPFVKTLTNLTDLGPDDGGTVVIDGSHKLDIEPQVLIDAALADPRLIHHVEAPAGSTLLFFESLIHSSGIIRSGRDRLLIIGGYTPTMYQTWRGYEPDPEFAQTQDEATRSLLTGDQKYHWERKLRRLADPVPEP
ncbi:MAG: phytanoyl-CoA dioxygenase family protein [Candidatus Latescibacteria bacterium]|nr:phytanoyl-CoA dioxygenase family protein [Candidatus Latescibacterota bacterium]